MEEVAEGLVRELPAALTCPPPSCEITLTPFYRCYHLVWWPGFLWAHVFSITRLTLIPTFLSRAYVFLRNSRFPSPVPLSLFLLIPIPSMRIALSLQYRACFRLSHSLSSIPPSSRDNIEANFRIIQRDLSKIVIYTRLEACSRGYEKFALIFTIKLVTKGRKGWNIPC